MRWRTRIHVPGLQLTSHEQPVAITTPYGQKLMGMFRYGEWKLPAEAILGMAGIHNPVARSKCITDLEREAWRNPVYQTCSTSAHMRSSECWSGTGASAHQPWRSPPRSARSTWTARPRGST